MTRIPVKSLLLAFFGAAAILFGAAMVQTNEGLAGRRWVAAEKLEGMVRTADPGRVDPLNEGHLVRVSGLATTAEQLEDPLFGVRATALLLERKVETYQWAEAEQEGSSSYSPEWAEEIADASTFAEPEGHHNPAEPRFPANTLKSGNVTLGAFVVPEVFITSFPHREPLPLTSLAGFPEELQAGAKLHDGQAFFGADPQAPKIGDTRVSFEITPPARVHLLGRQRGRSFEHFGNRQGISYLVMKLEEAPLFPHLEGISSSRIWGLRAFGVAALTIGLLLLRAALPAARRPSPTAVICLALAIVAAVSAASWSAFSALHAAAGGALSLAALLAAVTIYRRAGSPAAAPAAGPEPAAAG